MKDRSKPIEICRHCIDDDWMDQFYAENDWENFNAEYCVTKCNNNFVPKYLPKEQVIKYLRTKHCK
jgi:hypothetical protein